MRRTLSPVLAATSCGVLAALFAGGIASAGAPIQQQTAPPTPPACAAIPAAQTATLVPLTVHVGYTVAGGAQPGPGIGGPPPTDTGPGRSAPPVASQPAPPSQPVAGAEVDAVPAGDGSAPPVATAITDDTGTVTLSLPPGNYWVYVPASNASISPLSTAGLSGMPDGTVVLLWQAIDLSDGNPAEISLTAQLSAP